MFNTNSKLFDQIFELKFTAKMLVKESKRCETEERSQKTKAKQAMAKGVCGGSSKHVVLLFVLWVMKNLVPNGGLVAESLRRKELDINV